MWAHSVCILRVLARSSEASWDIARSFSMGDLDILQVGGHPWSKVHEISLSSSTTNRRLHPWLDMVLLAKPGETYCPFSGRWLFEGASHLADFLFDSSVIRSAVLLSLYLIIALIRCSFIDHKIPSALAVYKPSGPLWIVESRSAIDVVEGWDLLAPFLRYKLPTVSKKRINPALITHSSLCGVCGGFEAAHFLPRAPPVWAPGMCGVRLSLPWRPAATSWLCIFSDFTAKR